VALDGSRIGQPVLHLETVFLTGGERLDFAFAEQ
jgi:hypothetical protein